MLIFIFSHMLSRKISYDYQNCTFSFADFQYPTKLQFSNLLPTGSEEREVLEVGSIPVASCQDMKTITLKCREISKGG